MSEEQKNDAQADEEAEVEETKAEEPVETGPDVADEEELDIEIERVAPKKASSCGPIAWIVFIIVLAVAAIFAAQWANRGMAEKARADRAIRDETYQAQEQNIDETIQTASQLAGKGDLEGAFKELENAQANWGKIASTAQSNRDTDKAEYANIRKKALMDAMKELEGYRGKAAALAKRADELADRAKELGRERDEFNAKTTAKIAVLAMTGGRDMEGEGVGAPLEPETKEKAEEPKAKDEKKAADKPVKAKEAKETKKAPAKAKAAE